MQELWQGWETVRELGTGSFGAVYEIERDVFGTTERAALKVVSVPQGEYELKELRREGYDEESITARFRSYLEDIVREYTTMSKMNGNTNVVYCDDIRYVQHEDGIGWDIYIKMELLTPMMDSLQTVCNEKSVIRMGLDISNALIGCSRFNLIHRDIKPQNIFLSADGSFKLGDFGIAKTVERTQGGTKIGTYKYMAPEVYNNRPYGAGVDIYSLGLVMYWLLNDRRTPFLPEPPEMPTALQEDEAKQRRFDGEPLPPPRHGSDALKKIILKACAYDPAERYASPDELRQALLELPQTVQAAAPAEELSAPAGAPMPEPLPDDRTESIYHSPETSEKHERAVLPVEESADNAAVPERSAPESTPEMQPDDEMTESVLHSTEKKKTGSPMTAEDEVPKKPHIAENNIEDRTVPVQSIPVAFDEPEQPDVFEASEQPDAPSETPEDRSLQRRKKIARIFAFAAIGAIIGSALLELCVFGSQKHLKSRQNAEPVVATEALARPSMQADLETGVATENLDSSQECKEDVLVSQYQQAKQLFADGDYETAKSIFLAMNNYEDAMIMVKKCDYYMAVKLMNAGEYAKAAEIFIELPSYLSADNHAAHCCVLVARDLAKNNQISELASYLYEHNTVFAVGKYYCYPDSDVEIFYYGYSDDIHQDQYMINYYIPSGIKDRNSYAYRVLLISLDEQGEMGSEIGVWDHKSNCYWASNIGSFNWNEVIKQYDFE